MVRLGTSGAEGQCWSHGVAYMYANKTESEGLEGVISGLRTATGDPRRSQGKRGEGEGPPTRDVDPCAAISPDVDRLWGGSRNNKAEKGW